MLKNLSKVSQIMVQKIKDTESLIVAFENKSIKIIPFYSILNNCPKIQNFSQETKIIKTYFYFSQFNILIAGLSDHHHQHNSGGISIWSNTASSEKGDKLKFIPNQGITFLCSNFENSVIVAGYSDGSLELYQIRKKSGK